MAKRSRTRSNEYTRNNFRSDLGALQEDSVIAITPYKTFSAGEVLSAADLNSSFTKITDNGEGLAWPATTAKDLNGQIFILDADGDTSITADTDDQIDVAIGGSDVLVITATSMKFNGAEISQDGVSAILAGQIFS